MEPRPRHLNKKSGSKLSHSKVPNMAIPLKSQVTASQNIPPVKEANPSTHGGRDPLSSAHWALEEVCHMQDLTTQSPDDTSLCKPD